MAYAVKNGFEEGLVTPILINYFTEEAKKKRKSLEAYLQDIGERGIEQARTSLLEGLKKDGVKIRDIEIRLNHSNGKSFRVAEVQVHPRYNPGEPTGFFVFTPTKHHQNRPSPVGSFLSGKPLRILERGEGKVLLVPP